MLGIEIFAIGGEDDVRITFVHCHLPDLISELWIESKPIGFKLCDPPIIFVHFDMVPSPPTLLRPVLSRIRSDAFISGLKS